MKSVLNTMFDIVFMSTYIARLALSVKWGRFRRKRLFFVLGTPIHGNLGDQAIAIAEKNFINARATNALCVMVPMPFIMQIHNDFMARLIHPEDVLVGHGGGNIGDAYVVEEICRRKFVQQFPNNRIVIFPQTMHFSESRKGLAELRKTQEIYSAHEDLTIIARERTSFEAMRRAFPKTRVVLTPDIVLTTKNPRSRKRNGVLICLRNDLEGSLAEKDKEEIEDFALSHFGKIRYTDTISSNPFFKARTARAKGRAVRDKLDQFGRSKLVITDRLHGMVFAAISGTPCIAISNYNHKVLGTYGWVSYLPYIQFSEGPAELEKAFNWLNIDEQYFYKPSHFDNYWQTIYDAIT